MSPRSAVVAATVDDALVWLRGHLATPANLRADSRAVEAGDAFMAYAVDGADNRAYIAKAFERGAAAVLYQPEGFVAAPTDTQAAPAFAVPHLNELAGPIASRWYGAPSESMRIIAVTGTNGKTSCSHWVAHALSALGTPCAIVGTLGTGLPAALKHTGFTTPDAPQLQCGLARLRDAGAQAVAMEVSSHALHQGRVNGTKFELAIFTNLTQDHLDYHGTFKAYEASKSRLFDWPGLRCAVVNRDDAAGRRLIKRLKGKVKTITYGIGAGEGLAAAAGEDRALWADEVRPTSVGTAFRLTSDWGCANVEVAMLGSFNVSNLLAVLGALLALDVPFPQAVAQLARLEPVAGRMQRLGGRLQSDEPLVVIDYAHTPDALEQTLAALRPVADERGGALVCVFGCGGDRDPGKRAVMGEIAERMADAVVITSDNPRGEAPGVIIKAIAAGMKDSANARCIEDRASAILQSIRTAGRADVVVLAGKGHEATQEILGKKRPFSDQDHARLALAARVKQPRGEGE